MAPVTVQGADEAAYLNNGSEHTGFPPVPVNLPERVERPTPRAASTASYGRYLIIACLVLLMVGVTVYEFRSNPRQSAAKVETAGANTTIRPRRAVAVLGFRNLAGRPDDNWLSTAFTEMLSTELAAGGSLRLVPGEDVARAKRELPLADEDTLARSTLERLRTNPGADVVVLGSYTLLPGKDENRIRLDIRLQDTVAGETIAEQALTGSEDKLFELAAQAGSELRQSLGASAVSGEAINAARASLPSNQKAVRLYAEGRAKLWAFDFQGARDLLIKAVAADPNYPLTHPHSLKPGGTWAISVKRERKRSRPWICRSICRRKNSCWSKDSTGGRWPTGKRRCRRIKRCSIFSLIVWITVCYWHRRKSGSGRLIRCRRWTLFAILLRRRVTMRVLT